MSSCEMPIPVSATVMRSVGTWRSAPKPSPIAPPSAPSSAPPSAPSSAPASQETESSTDPPGPVNLSALLTRFVMILRRISQSLVITGTSGSMRYEYAMPAFSAMGTAMEETSAATSTTSTSSETTSNLPASSRAASTVFVIIE